MSSLKILAGETIVYGVSTMLGRFLNWLLMPFYIRTILPDEYGVIINIYGVISILLVIFTYGLETGFFRFSRKGEQADVFTTSLVMIGSTSLLFIIFISLSASNISNFYYDGNYSVSLILVSIIVAIDCFLAIPFANLRLNNQALKFGTFKLGNIALNIFFNLLFLLVIPYFIKNSFINGYWVEVFNKGNGVFYILLSNALSSVITFFFFWNEFRGLKGKFQLSLLFQLIKYSWPVLIVGITGMVIQNIDKVLMPKLIGENGFKALAVYGANFKIGVLMSLFTQSFRFAFEPYFFKIQEKGKESYAKVMEYFIFFGVLIFLGVMLFIDIINILLTKEYLYGNVIIPYVLLGQLLYGIYFNLSLWYKLTDRTIFGAIFGTGGTVITVTLLYILIPTYGIIGGALSIMIGYGVMMVVSYFLGQKYYNIPYSLSKIGLIIFIGLLAFLTDIAVNFDHMLYRFMFKGLIFAFYVFLFLLINKTIRFKTAAPWLKLKL
jgi:O-antigen/teichoic acid export membrane protein